MKSGGEYKWPVDRFNISAWSRLEGVVETSEKAVMTKSFPFLARLVGRGFVLVDPLPPSAVTDDDARALSVRRGSRCIFSVHWT